VITVSAVSSPQSWESPVLADGTNVPVVLDAAVARHFPER